MKMFGDIYRGRRVLVTGHTGFKGSWLALWLKELGAIVTGISLAPKTNPNHWELLGLAVNDCRVDIRNEDILTRLIKEIRPEIIFHLAAQPLVRHSYHEPVLTWSTNVMGTVNLLEASRHTNSVRAIVVITTDKCYENNEWVWGYREIDPLGGHDPYSASKASTELVVASYRKSFFNSGTSTLIATARAGNVIGGGDWSEDRLIPDLVRAVTKGEILKVRSPQSRRPWQHVLESLSGYLQLGQKLLIGDKIFADAWNFGPEQEGNCTVAEVLGKLTEYWPALCWRVEENLQMHEAKYLYLDSSKARTCLQWQSVWNLDTALEKTAKWYRVYMERRQIISLTQLTEYITDAEAKKVGWVRD